jgi:nitrogen fixation NifU-like protein
LHIYLQVADDRIEGISFEGSGCAISKASASLMTAALKGKGVAEAEQLFEDFHAMVMADVAEPIDETKLGKMAIFAGVREFPMRVKCATLAWHAMKSALSGADAPISTE